MVVVAAVLVVSLLACVVVLFRASPGTPAPILDGHGRPLAGSLAEKIHVPINGVEQGMFIKATDIRKPVLLFVHGGPGMPEYWLTATYPTGLENDFVVAWWDQRGAGLSFHPHMPPSTMTAGQFVEDTLAVTDYLRQRFHQDRIYLLAHSWGSYIGLQAVARSPERYHAYIGMGQITHQLRSERLAYDYALARYRDMGDRRMVRRLEAAPPTSTVPLPAAYESLRDDYMHGIGIGTTRQMRSVVTGIFLPSWRFSEYTVGEKISLWRGKRFSRSPQFGLWDRMQNTDLALQVPELRLPAYFLHGRYDYTCAYPLARAYVQGLRAPLKGFYTFEHSAHSPVFEEPARVRTILREDVLTGHRRLADPL